MSDSYSLLDSLGRALCEIERVGFLLDDLLVPSVDYGFGDRVGGGGVPGSRAPLSVGLLDVKVRAEEIVCGWCGCLVDDDGFVVGQAPLSRVLVVRAGWLYRHLDRVELMPWFGDCADELVSLADELVGVVEPDDSDLVRVPERSSAVMAASWASQVLGVVVKAATVRQWIRRGKVVRGADGLVSIREVVDVAAGMSAAGVA